MSTASVALHVFVGMLLVKLFDWLVWFVARMVSTLLGSLFVWMGVISFDRWCVLLARLFVCLCTAATGVYV